MYQFQNASSGQSIVKYFVCKFGQHYLWYIVLSVKISFVMEVNWDMLHEHAKYLEAIVCDGTVECQHLHQLNVRASYGCLGSEKAQSLLKGQSVYPCHLPSLHWT